MDNFIENYLKLLILQYRGKPKAEATIKANIEKYKEINQVLEDLIKQTDIDTASGVNLDLLGRIIGLSRVIPDIIPKKYFGFNNNNNALGFGEGVFYRTYYQKYTSTELNDFDYRFFLKSKIIKNIIKDKIYGENSIQDAISFLFGGYAYVSDNQDMSITIYVEDNNKVIRLIPYLNKLDLLPKPAGIKIRAMIKFNRDFFGFNNNPNSKGFNIGKFARIIQM